MIDEKAFLETIKERFKEDGPRLVYADWLEEQGRSEEAELIRIQCESRYLARLQGAARTHDRAIYKLTIRAGQLLTKLKYHYHVQWPVVREDQKDTILTVEERELVERQEQLRLRRKDREARPH